MWRCCCCSQGRPGHVTEQGPDMSCLLKEFSTSIQSWISNGNILMQLMWNPICPLRGQHGLPEVPISSSQSSADPAWKTPADTESLSNSRLCCNSLTTNGQGLLACLRNSTAFWKVPRLLSFVLLVRATCSWRWVWGQGWNGADRGKPPPEPLYPSEISHRIAWDKTRAPVVTGRPLTTWVMALPIQALNLS